LRASQGQFAICGKLWASVEVKLCNISCALLMGEMMEFPGSAHKRLLRVSAKANETLRAAHEYIRETHADLLQDDSFLQEEGGKRVAFLLAEISLTVSALETMGATCNEPT